MTAAMSRKKNPARIWTQTIMCECCGKFIVLLRHRTWTEKEKRWVVCYARGWDGNPWFVEGGRFARNAVMHPRGRWSEWMLQKPPSEDLLEDPFFSLD